MMHHFYSYSIRTCCCGQTMLAIFSLIWLISFTNSDAHSCHSRIKNTKTNLEIVALIYWCFVTHKFVAILFRPIVGTNVVAWRWYTSMAQNTQTPRNNLWSINAMLNDDIHSHFVRTFFYFIHLWPTQFIFCFAFMDNEDVRWTELICSFCYFTELVFIFGTMHHILIFKKPRVWAACVSKVRQCTWDALHRHTPTTVSTATMHP